MNPNKPIVLLNRAITSTQALSISDKTAAAGPVSMSSLTRRVRDKKPSKASKYHQKKMRVNYRGYIIVVVILDNISFITL